MYLQKTIYGLSSLALVLAVLLGIALVRQQSDEAGNVRPVSSLADARRRLELAGYSYDRDVSVAGMHVIAYQRQAAGGTYMAEIVRYSGAQRPYLIALQCATDGSTIDSAEARKEMWAELNADVCTLVNESDYHRALAEMKKAGNATPPFEGRATSAQGWQIHTLDFAGCVTTGETVPLAKVMLFNLEAQEDIPISAIREYQQFEQQFQRAQQDTHDIET
jgi:predicted RNase H-like HicB family nuclease